MMIRNHITEKILVVDDNHTTRDIICRFLKGQGYKVSHAADGSGALERFSQDTFDLVLADFAMPGLNGVDLTLCIHSLAPQTPVIIMSGHAGAQKENALGAGAADFIEKPLLLDELLTTIRNQMPDRKTLG
jgi:DNA-binding NtrC family response regulator